jgi:hypothetical protein
VDRLWRPLAGPEARSGAEEYLYTPAGLRAFGGILGVQTWGVEEAVVAVLHLVQHLLRLRQLLLRRLLHAAQQVYLLH